MKRPPVDSSSIASIGYSPDARRLQIEFRTGRVYEYDGVPESIYRELMGAESRGRYFSTSIRPAGFPYRKVA